MREHSRVDVDGNGLAAVGAGDPPQGRQHAARVIDVAVRQDERLDAPHVEAETRGVAVDRIARRPAVEQKPMGAVAETPRHHQGIAPAGATEAVPGKGLGTGLQQVRDLPGHAVGKARHAVAHVVDEDRDLRPVQGFEGDRLVPQKTPAHGSLLRLDDGRNRCRRRFYNKAPAR